MIPDALIRLLTLLLVDFERGILALIPAPPDWAQTGFTAAGELWTVLQGFDTWLPVDFAFTVAAAVIVAYFISAVIGATRWIVSYFVLGGGTT